MRYDQVNAMLVNELLSAVAPRYKPYLGLGRTNYKSCSDISANCERDSAHTRAILGKTKNPVSPPPDVTLTIGVADRRTIAPQTLPRKRNGFVSTNIGCNFHSVSLKIGNTSGANRAHPARCNRLKAPFRLPGPTRAHSIAHRNEHRVRRNRRSASEQGVTDFCR